MNKTLFRTAVEKWNASRSADEHAEALELLQESIGPLSGDELDVIGYLLERAKVGRAVYGELKLDSDGRDWLQETGDELHDGLFYTAAFALKVRRRVEASQARPALRIVGDFAPLEMSEG